MNDPVKNWTEGHKRLWLAMNGFAISSQNPIPSTADAEALRAASLKDVGLMYQANGSWQMIGKFPNFEALFKAAWDISNDVTQVMNDRIRKVVKDVAKDASRVDGDEWKEE